MRKFPPDFDVLYPPPFVPEPLPVGEEKKRFTKEPEHESQVVQDMEYSHGGI